MSTSPNYQRYSRCITVAVRLDNTDIGVPDSLYRKRRIRPAGQVMSVSTNLTKAREKCIISRAHPYNEESCELKTGHKNHRKLREYQ